MSSGGNINMAGLYFILFLMRVIRNPSVQIADEGKRNTTIVAALRKKKHYVAAL